MIQRIEYGSIPFYRIGTPTGFHIEQTDLVIGCLRNVPFAGSRPIQIELHIRLTGAKPYFPCQYIIVYYFLLVGSDGQGIRTTRIQRIEGHPPLAVRCRYRLFLLSGNGHRYLLSGIRLSLNGQDFAVLQHHVVRIHARQLQAAEITGNAFVHHLGQDSGTFRIRMHRIFQHIRIRIERFVEVNQLNTLRLGNALNRQLDFFVPITGTRFKTEMTVRKRSHPGNQETSLRIHLAERLHQCTIITDEFIPIVRPVAWVGIVDTQMNHHDISGKCQRILVFLLLGIRTMSLVQQGRSRLTEITYFVLVAQHLLESHRISVLFPFRHTGSICDAVTYTSYFYLLLCISSARKKHPNTQ